MSSIPTNSICSKLQKWINLNPSSSIQHSLHQPHNHSHHSHHPHHSHSHYTNSIHTHNSPYKPITFQTLLRYYPQPYHHQREASKSLQKHTNPSNTLSQLYTQNTPKPNPKRTYQNRINYYANIKSKINTNLSSLKLSIPQSTTQNNQNINTLNLINPQTDHQKLTFHKKPIKKIKLNSQYLKKLQPPKDHFDSCVDVQDMIIKHNFRPNELNEKNQNSSTLFRINVAKKINLFTQNTRKENQINQESSQETYQHGYQKKSQVKAIQMKSSILVEETQNELNSAFSGNKESQQYDNPTTLLNLEEGSNFIFKKGESQFFQIQQNRENSEENNIFTLDGFRILENENLEQNNSINNHTQDQQNYNCERPDQIFLDQIVENQENSANDSQNENQKFKFLENLEQAVSIFCNFSQTILKKEQFALENQPEKNQTQKNKNSNEQKQNISQNIRFDLQAEKPKPTQQRIRKNSRPKKQSKILTRAKQEKLNLFNQLSMRLIRKKYGQRLTHSQLADKMLSQENKIELKAFIESGDLKDYKTVFSFNQLTQIQMKNILIRYFASQQLTSQ